MSKLQASATCSFLCTFHLACVVCGPAGAVGPLDRLSSAARRESARAAVAAAAGRGATPKRLIHSAGATPVHHAPASHARWGRGHNRPLHMEAACVRRGARAVVGRLLAPCSSSSSSSARLSCTRRRRRGGGASAGRQQRTAPTHHRGIQHAQRMHTAAHSHGVRGMHGAAGFEPYIVIRCLLHSAFALMQ